MWYPSSIKRWLRGKSPQEKSYQRISDLVEPPVVGETYLVPTIKFAHLRLPVLQRKPHSDPELSNPVVHWHVDIRFATDKELKTIGHTIDSLYPNPRLKADSRYQLPVVDDHGHKAVDIPRICKREMPNYIAEHVIDDNTIVRYTIPGILELENKMAGARLKSCKVCPHRATPLGNIKVVNGLIVCPAHNLQFDAETGELVPRKRDN